MPSTAASPAPALLATIQHLRIYQHADGSIRWPGPASICGDGSPRAYHPTSGPGLDRLANAMHKPDEWRAGVDYTRTLPPSGWAGIVLGANGLPVVQGKEDPAPGFFVSGTKLVDTLFPESDPRRYLDSEKVAFAVLPSRLLHPRGPLRLGDLGEVTWDGRSVAVVFGDVGPGCCEISIRAAEVLGIPSSPRKGGVRGAVSYVAFPGTAKGWPLTAEEIGEAVRGLVQTSPVAIR